MFERDGRKAEIEVPHGLVNKEASEIVQKLPLEIHEAIDAHVSEFRLKIANEAAKLRGKANGSDDERKIRRYANDLITASLHKALEEKI